MTKAISFVLRHLSFCLFTGIIVLIWYLIMALSYNPYGIRLAQKHTKTKEVIKRVPGKQLRLQPSLQQFPYYGNIFKSHELFKVNEEAEESDSGSSQPRIEPAVTIAELVEKFSLMGLISVNGTYEAVLQNKQTSHIYYSKEGDTIEELTIKKITSNKVIFQYKKEEASLAL